MKRLFGKKSTRHRSTSTPQSTDEEPQQQSTAEYLRVVDDNPHASDGKTSLNKQGDRFKLRGNWKRVHLFYIGLASFDQIKAVIDVAGWSRLLPVDMPNSDQRLVESCVERWWDTTHTFHLPLVELGISPYDFTFITGIAVGEGIPLPEYNDTLYRDAASTIDRYFPGAAFDKYSSSAIKLADVADYLETAIGYLGAGNQLDPVVIGRAFLFFTIGALFFPNAKSTIPVGWLSYLDDVSKVGDYDWGSAILGRIYFALDSCCRREVRSLDCFWQFIEYFFYEYTHTSIPVLRQADTDYWPRVIRWSRGERATTMVKGSVRFKYASHQQQLEMRSAKVICWTPFGNSQWTELQVIQNVFRLSMHRMLLWDPQLGGTWYLGDRSYRQLTGTIVIPHNPPTPMSRVSRQEYDMIRLNGWAAASNFITVATQSEYDNYFSKVSRGAVVPPLTRYVNTDGIGYAAIVPPHIRLPQPPTPDYSPGVYSTQTTGASSSQSSQQIHRFNWTADVAAPDGATITIDVARRQPSSNPPLITQTPEQWRELYIDAREYARALQDTLMQQTRLREEIIAEKDTEIQRLQSNTYGSSANLYRPSFSTPNLGDNSGQYASQNMTEEEFNNLWSCRR